MTSENHIERELQSVLANPKRKPTREEIFAYLGKSDPCHPEYNEKEELTKFHSDKYWGVGEFSSKTKSKAEGEIIFEVTFETDVGYTAEAWNYDIFTQADTWEGLRENVREAVSAFFFDTPGKFTLARFHFSHNEVFALP